MGETRIPRVLVVDDSEELREVFSIVLQEGGYEIATAGGVEEAFEYVKRERPDLVITDVMMNGPVGLDLITRIRSDLAPPLPEVLACSGFSNFREEALRRGAISFLTKPIGADDLLAAVAAALEGAAARMKVEQIAMAAEQRTLGLRRAAIESAAKAMKTIEPRRDEVDARAKGAVTWLANYLDLTEVQLLLIEGEALRSRASSRHAEESPTPSPEPRWRAFAHDVLESQSSIVLPDARRFLGNGKTSTEIGLFVGVPLFGPGGVAVGAVCVMDTSPRSIEPEDLALVMAWARSGSAILEGAVGKPSMFAWPGLLSRDSLTTLIRNESDRLRRSGAVLELAVLKLPPRVDVGLAADSFAAATDPSRRALAALEDHTLGVLLVRADRDEATRELARGIVAVQKRGLLGAGVASVENPTVQLPGTEQLIDVCERLAERGEIERMTIRGERWEPELAATPP